MRSSRARDVLVGVTALIGLGGVLLMSVLFGFAPRWLEGGYSINVVLDEAAGLTAGSRIRLRGIDVGRVTSVELRSEPTRQVWVAARITREGLTLPEGVKVSVDKPVIGGSPALALDDSDVPTDAPALPTDGTATIRGETATLAEGIVGQMRQALSEPMDKLGRLSDTIEELADQWTGVGQQLNTLLSDRDPAAVDAGEAEANLVTVVRRIDARLVELRDAIAAVQAWVEDPKLKDDLRATLASARDVGTKLDEGAGKVNALVEQASQSLDRLTRRYAAVADDLSAAMAGFRHATDEVTRGEGTAAKLLNDPALYNNLNDTAQRLNKALDELRLLVEKWRAEGLDVQF